MVGKGGGGDDKRLHSLMNLVMQFRKVCVHQRVLRLSRCDT